MTNALSLTLTEMLSLMTALRMIYMRVIPLFKELDNNAVSIV